MFNHRIWSKCNVFRRVFSAFSTNCTNELAVDNGFGSSDVTLKYLHVQNKDIWPKEILDKVVQEVALIPNFVSPEDEQAFVEETAVLFKRLRYEKNHWDDVRGFKNASPQH